MHDNSLDSVDNMCVGHSTTHTHTHIYPFKLHLLYTYIYLYTLAHNQFRHTIAARLGISPCSENLHICCVRGINMSLDAATAHIACDVWNIYVWNIYELYKTVTINNLFRTIFRIKNMSDSYYPIYCRSTLSPVYLVHLTMATHLYQFVYFTVNLLYIPEGFIYGGRCNAPFIHIWIGLRWCVSWYADGVFSPFVCIYVNVVLYNSPYIQTRIPSHLIHSLFNTAHSAMIGWRRVAHICI